MEAKDYIDNRRRRNLARLMEVFEDRVEDPLALDRSDPDDRELIEGIDAFKVHARKTLQAFATDCTDLLEMSPNFHVNGIAIAARDRLT